MGSPDMYVVIEHNQASGQPGGQHVEFYDSLLEAVEMREELTGENRAAGRRETYRIYRLEQVEEDEMWEWAVRGPATGGRPFRYLHENAARCSRPKDAEHQLLKRRFGTDEWTVVPTADQGGQVTRAYL